MIPIMTAPETTQHVYYIIYYDWEGKISGAVGSTGLTKVISVYNKCLINELSITFVPKSRILVMRDH